MEFIFVSKNKGKLKEFKNFFKDLNIKFVLFDKKIEEEGLTFFENAYLKAKAGFEERKIPSIGEDSGLVVDYLYGMPGIFSNRFSEEGDDKGNRKKLLELLKDIPFYKRKAKFVCIIVLFLSKEKFFVFKGEVEGFISFEERGEYGFGYDPIFLYPQLGRTFAELPVYIKNKVSHRGKALKEFKRFIIQNESNLFG